LKLQGRDYQQTLDQLIKFRDLEDNPENSGPAQAFIDWVWQQQLPRLIADPFYRKQFSDEIDAKGETILRLQHQIKQQAGSLQEEAACLAIERLKLLELFSADDDGGGV
jgi:hypothetical protein